MEWRAEGDEVRAGVLEFRDYISGETLHELDDPSLFVVVSTWANLEAWRTWQVSMRRLLIEQGMDSLITTEKKLHIFALDYET